VKLVRKLWKHGIPAVRVLNTLPEYPAPDVIAFGKEVTVAFEVKHTSLPPEKINITLKHRQAKRLLDFSLKTKSQPYVAVYVEKQDKWYVIPLQPLITFRKGLKQTNITWAKIRKYGVELEKLVELIAYG